MSTSTPTVRPDPAPAPDGAPQRLVRRKVRAGATVLAQGEPMLWLTGGGLVICVAMIVGLLLLILWQGITTFWPQPLLQVKTLSGRTYLGEVTQVDSYRLSYGSLPLLTEREQESVGKLLNVQLQNSVAAMVETGELADRIVEFSQRAGDSLGEHIASAQAVRNLAANDQAEFVTQVKTRVAELGAKFRERLLTDIQAAQQDTSGSKLAGLWAKHRAERDTVLAESDFDTLKMKLGTEATAYSLWSAEVLANVGVRVHVPMRRRLLRTGNYELTNEHFTWINDYEVGGTADESYPPSAHLFERLTWGRFYGFPKSLLIDDQSVVNTPDQLIEKFQELHAECRARWHAARKLEKHDVGDVNHAMEHVRLGLRDIELEHGLNSPEWKTAKAAADEKLQDLEQSFAEIRRQITEHDQLNSRYKLLVTTAAGQDFPLALADIVRMYAGNELGFGEKVVLYLSRWGEFLAEDPREANSEGGVFPAIFGTVAMTMLLALVVVPFGVLAALYLREYAKPGPMVSIVRIAVNNLAGVPSIVFGVFGMGFFCYVIGAFVDGGPSHIGIEPWPPAQWFLIAGIAAVLALGGFLAGVISLNRNNVAHRGRKIWIGRLSFLLWIAATCVLVALIAKTPFFDGFYRAKLPTPTYGTGGLMWAAMTLALLTLPVVIVATEEALAAVPRSMREGSLACGATKWQTIQRIVLPRALPGIMTGMILAMARGAGEVAPLMLVGALKLVPHLPIDLFDWSGSFGPVLTGPVHPERSFMHLGFHIYDLGFQSPNSEAAKPMVFTTTLLLIALIGMMNLLAITIRTRLRKKYQIQQF